jgi:Amiloride-sensitive sodium channel
MAYNIVALLCDIGGTLGLLMGASVLTMCELLEVLWSRLLQTLCRSGKKGQKSKRMNKVQVSLINREP